MKKNSQNRNEQIEKVLQTLAGLTEVSELNPRPPKGLEPRKKALFGLLSLGIGGIVVLVRMNAPWYAYLTLVTMVTITSVIIMQKK